MSPVTGGGGLPAGVALTRRFYRHQPLRTVEVGGSTAGGRYSPRGAFEAIYLGRPLASVLAEAYRRLVDPYEVDPAMVVRALFEVEVALARVLDLRDARARRSCGLSLADLRGPRERCQPVGQRAFDAGYEGLIAPSASGLGDTLCVFAARVGEGALVVLAREEWRGLPPDPRVAE